MFEESASAAPASMWESMASWFSPTVLFLLLNIVIATIAFNSKLANKKDQQTQQQPDSHHETTHQIVRPPSSLLHRLKSINIFTNPQNLSNRHKPSPDSDSDTLFNQKLEAQSHYFFQENIQVVPQSRPHYVLEDRHEQDPQELQTQFVSEQKDSVLDDFQQALEDKLEENELQSMDDVYSHLTGGLYSRTKSDTVPTSGEMPAKLPARIRKSASSKSAFGHFEEGEILEARRPATVRENGSAKVTEGDQEVDAKADDFINKFKQQLKLQRLDSIIRYKDMIGSGRKAVGGKS